MDHPRILIQLDSDAHASVFDAVVGIDSQIDHLLQYSNVESSNAQALAHGAMFTRGPEHLKNTAIFVGGSDVSAGEAISQVVRESFFGPVSVSVMLDANGCNTTAAAAVLCAARHAQLQSAKAFVLGGTGPVGQRVARLLLQQGAEVTLSSRSHERAASACQRVSAQVGEVVTGGSLTPFGLEQFSPAEALRDQQIVISCGAAAVQLLDAAALAAAAKLKVAIDLNAVPPAGIEGIAATDKAVGRGGRVDYGAIGVGGLKMRIHREAIQTLFTRNDHFLDAEQIFEIGQELEAAKNV